MPQPRARQATDIRQPVDLRACQRSGHDAAERASHVEPDRKRNEINGSHSLAKGMDTTGGRGRKAQGSSKAPGGGKSDFGPPAPASSARFSPQIFPLCQQPGFMGGRVVPSRSAD